MFIFGVSILSILLILFMIAFFSYLFYTLYLDYKEWKKIKRTTASEEITTSNAWFHEIMETERIGRAPGHIYPSAIDESSHPHYVMHVPSGLSQQEINSVMANDLLEIVEEVTDLVNSDTDSCCDSNNDDSSSYGSDNCDSSSSSFSNDDFSSDSSSSYDSSSYSSGSSDSSSYDSGNYDSGSIGGDW